MATSVTNFNAAGGPPTTVACHRCRYDLRAHGAGGACPECGASVAASVAEAAVPQRPAWRASDPRWRRRMLAGLWVLVLLPLVDVLQGFDWLAAVPAPVDLWPNAAIRTLDDTLLGHSFVYAPLAFCIGTTLLFSAERGRRPGRLDWTRRWGVLAAYVTFLLWAAGLLFIAALVLVGVSRVLLSMPAADQPWVTQVIVNCSVGWLKHGPQPGTATGVVQAAASATVVLLACRPVYHALRSTGPKRLAAVVVAPLALSSVPIFIEVGRRCTGTSSARTLGVADYGIYFRPVFVAAAMPRSDGRYAAAAPWGVGTGIELVKWGTVLTAAVWLTVAQLTTMGRRRAGRR